MAVVRIPGLPKEKLKLIQPISRVENVKKGERVFTEGDKYRGPFYVVNGNFKIFCTSPMGKESILQVYRKNQIMAPAPIFVQENYFYSCIALADGTLLSFDLDKLRDVLQKDAGLCFFFGTITCITLLGFRQKIIDLTLKSAEERMLDYLRTLGAERRAVNFGMRKNQLALLLDLTPESVSRIIAQLKKSGSLVVKGDKYEITKKSRTQKKT